MKDWINSKVSLMDTRDQLGDRMKAFEAVDERFQFGTWVRMITRACDLTEEELANIPMKVCQVGCDGVIKIVNTLGGFGHAGDPATNKVSDGKR